MDATTVPQPPSCAPRRPVLVVLGLALLPVVVGVFVLIRGSDHPAAAARVTPSVVVPPTPTRPATPTVAPPPPVVPHDDVAPAVPSAFTLTGPKFTIHARVCSMAAVFPLDPPGEQHHTVCWVQKGFGVRPGSHTATSYVLGHSWAPDPQEVLNKASTLATREILDAKPVRRDGVDTYPVHALDGYRLVLHTATGTLTYKVHDTYGVAKDQLGKVTSTMDGTVRNRVVLITCAERKGVDYHYNVVVIAYLWSSQRA